MASERGSGKVEVGTLTNQKEKQLPQLYTGCPHPNLSSSILLSHQVLTETHDKEIYAGFIKCAEVKIADNTVTARLALWDKCTVAATPGQVLEISKVRVKLFGEEKKLTTTTSSQLEACIQIINGQHLRL